MVRYYPMNLRDTGGFWSGINHKAKNGIVDYSDTDSKTKMLEDRYGEEILGLHEKSKEEMIPKWQQSLYEQIQTKLGA